MYDNFERQKNTKALSYTLMICCLLLLLFIFYKWPLALRPVSIPQDLIEVNLGNESEGLGDVQPRVKGNPAIESKAVQSKPSNPAAASHEIIKADEDIHQEAATINKPSAVLKTVPTPATNTEVKKPSAAAVAAPAKVQVPKLKIPLYKGSNGTGGNGAETDNGYRNQGYKGTNGDAGSAGGNPDSYGNSPTGRSGVSIVKGLHGRMPIHFPAMKDEFNENAKVYVEIIVDANGGVTDASIARGSTTSNSGLLNIALQKARQLKFPASSNEQEKGTILFNFILKN